MDAGTIADTAIRVIKITAVIAVASAFFVAIINIVNLISTFVMGSIVGEILAVFSACMPFNCVVVFGAIGAVCAAILSFLVAKKIFELTSWSISSI